MLDTSDAKLSRQRGLSDPDTHSDEEFYDCKSNCSSAKGSQEAVTTNGTHARDEFLAEGKHADTADVTNALQTQAQISEPLKRLRSLSKTLTVGDSHERGAGSQRALPLSRSASVKASLVTKSVDRADKLVEQRARRAIKAMAASCTTGMPIHIAGNRPGAQTGSRRLGSSSSSFSEHKGKGSHALHHVSSHSRLSELGSPEETEPLSSFTPEPDSRARSLTGEKGAGVLARGASLEARMDQKMRQKLQRWIMSFGTVHFDVDQGPMLQLLYPHVSFSSSERAAISFSSMPDSTIYELCDSVYTFNFRVDPVRLGLPKDRIFLHGYVFFRQKRDPLMRRGGFQRSVVIITHLPYHGLFSRLAHILGPLYFDLGTTILEAAAHNVTSWPQPGAGQAYELPFLGSALAVELPGRDANQLLETSRFPIDRFDPGEHILAGVECDGLFRSFRDTLDDLWACWELMILGEPLVVLADSPARCSDAIVGLVDIIYPIRYCGDWRPYFTIQDPDLRAIVSKSHVPPNTVVGVSNPFFSEALGHWPHKLVLGTSQRMAQMAGIAARSTPANESALGGSSGSTGWPVKQGLQTRRRCAVSRDRTFAEGLLKGLRSGRQTPWAVNNALRRHFMDLTVQFLAPLDRYFSTLIPMVRSATAIPEAGSGHAGPWTHAHQRSTSQPDTEAALSWFAAPGPVRPWRTGDFLASMASLGISPQLRGQATAAGVLAAVFTGSSSAPASSNGDNIASSGLPWRARRGTARVSDEWQQLYEQFLQCGNFATWLARRTEDAQRALNARFRQELCRGDVHAWCRGYDYPLGLSDTQLAAELEHQELATMDLGQRHVRHVFYHGEAADERARAERHRRQMLRDQQARLAGGDRPVYGSDGSLVGYTQRTPRALPAAPEPRSSVQRLKQLGQRITQAQRAQAAMLQAARQLRELLEQEQEQGGADEAGLRRQLSILLEYVPAEAGRAYLALVDDFQQ
ncbi:hypothetical protein LPJ78_004605 [Coemansia sp. RSA 989]|nr:hypothetical protein LPJ79_005314 [Coemansia sp. RSA 1821]KAJ1862620.1 hypothetical protein LPJ78_004605 [Coemansia sp. RSA 989]KAJ1870099.1 hypothetical protein LPJ55_004901 [Coemansia sp. RSA 990]KAJ2668429.1 hypothetical protein IWW42_005210 [Coemansia sp. RSA 1085]